jgi:hypothetical protein
MSLDFNFTAIKDYASITSHPTDPDKYHPVTYFLIWAMMAIGQREITKHTIDKVCERMSLYQLITGPAVVFSDGTKAYVTRADLEMHMGYRSNVSPETDSEFMQKMYRIALNHAVTNPGDVSAWAFTNNKVNKVNEEHRA